MKNKTNKYLKKHADVAIMLLPADVYIESWGVKQYVKSKMWAELYGAQSNVYKLIRIILKNN